MSLDFYKDKECPSCKVSFQGDEIPLSSQRTFGRTHYSRVILGYSDEDAEGYTRLSKLECPDCKHTWPLE